MLDSKSRVLISESTEKIPATRDKLPKSKPRDSRLKRTTSEFEKMLCDFSEKLKLTNSIAKKRIQKLHKNSTTTPQEPPKEKKVSTINFIENLRREEQEAYKRIKKSTQQAQKPVKSLFDLIPPEQRATITRLFREVKNKQDQQEREHLEQLAQAERERLAHEAGAKKALGDIE